MSQRTLPEGHKRRVSEDKKRASGFRRQRELLQFYDNYLSMGMSHDQAAPRRHRDAEFIRKCRINYDLFNGRLDPKEYDAPVITTMEGERVDLPQYEIVHNPVISQVANAMLGEQIVRPHKPQAVELGTSYHNAYKKKVTELMRDHMTRNIIMPNQQRAQSMWMKENGIEDPYTLQPEQQEEMRQQIGARAQAMNPREVADFMRNDFQTATQRQAQQLINYLNRELGIREMQNEGFKHAIITGREYYAIEDINGDPRMTLLNPMFFQWGGDQNEEWVQNGTWAKYETWRSFENIISDHGEHFKRGDWKRLEQFAEPMGGYDHLGDPQFDMTARTAMFMLTEENGYQAERMSDIDIRTRKGQQALTGFYNALSSRWGNSGNTAGFGIREATVTFRDSRKMFEVVKVVNGEKKKYWVAENYTPTKDDVEVYQHWVNDIWEGKVLGSYDPIYTKIRRVPNQHRSIYDPRKVLLPFVGKEYSSPMNNTKGVSPIDLGKPAQKDIDVLRAEIRQDMARDNGKVFAMVSEMKPDNITWTEFYTQMKVFKTVHLQNNKHGSTPTDANLIKTLDMSNAQSLAQKLSLLENAKTELIQAMYFNPTRMGMGGQYATTDTTRNNQAASFNQTEAFFDTHNQIVSKAYVQLINRSRYVLKDQPHKLDMIFDDVARANLELTHNVWTADLGVDVSLRNSDMKAIEELRGNMQALIQNGLSLEGTMDLFLAETTADIRSVVQRESRKMEEQRQEQMQATQAALAKQEETKLAEKKMEVESKAREKDLDRKAGQLRTETQSEQFRKQADVDNNKEADSITKARLDNETKERIEMAKIRLEREKLNLSKENLNDG